MVSVRGRANTLHSQLSAAGIDRSEDGHYTYLGNTLSIDLSEYMLACIDRGDSEAIIKFIKRLYENPSHDTRTRLFEFMDRNKMPIDNSGRFLAFKVVNSDYTDKHTRTIDNHPGITVPRMDWSEVDTDPTVTCSRGYHACSIDYLDFFFGHDDRVVSVAIGPEDVGAIPDDYDGAKLRCRQYHVVKDITEQYKRDYQKTKLHINSGDGIEINRDDTITTFFGFRRDFY